MSFVSITRLRLRSMRFLPVFAWHTFGTLRQVKRSPGFEGGALLPDGPRTFWTMTAWDSQASMRQYITHGSHRLAMPRLLDWCDEASVVHWEQPRSGLLEQPRSGLLEQPQSGLLEQPQCGLLEQPHAALPSWLEAERRMRADGRISKVRHPSADHAAMRFRAPRVVAAGSIRPMRAG